MVYTLTLNPSLDYGVWVKDFELGKTNRSNKEIFTLGGKGLNVSTVLSNLGVESTAICVVAGFVGDEIEKRLKDAKFISKIIKSYKGNSRINVKIQSEKETEINAGGPDLSQEELHRVLQEFLKVKKDDIVILSGSLPKNVDAGFYRDIIDLVKEVGAKVVVDATKETLKSAVMGKPFLVKPNVQELEELFGVPLNSIEEIKRYGILLRSMGAENVLVTMGEKGSMLVSEAGIMIQETVEGVVISSVGAGDSMIAGFVSGYLEKKDLKYALELGTACAQATCFSEGLATKENVSKLM